MPALLTETELEAHSDAAGQAHYVVYDEVNSLNQGEVLPQNFQPKWLLRYEFTPCKLPRLRKSRQAIVISRRFYIDGSCLRILEGTGDYLET